MAAIAEAERRGVDSVIPYALTLFDDPSWSPRGSRMKPAQMTNLSVDRKCDHCGGDRFVVVTYAPSVPYGENYAPCAACNADTNTEFWTADGRRFVSPPR